MDCYFCKICGVRVMHRVKNVDGSERPTVSIKGGLIEGLDWAQGKHIFTKTAVVTIPENAERWDGTPEPN